ncbi:PIR protein [Plasmodium yoelii]|uniref:Yir4 protein n=3 Tax=Plasmodium yoelii TaxID=5861 RepID=Q7RS71_PLAYO|nr:PIR protein [Plasmodium yoelii]EAA16349.1 putative yir4 protein [Plasmodium yoelii yoelii]WBY54389.1 PIR protein [Plasmodium yoelii yoelii]VTZ71408.1 PIR protein [Plasmodium yoelii]|eukprot:XP_034493319.1 PIR protein [Plasmodium yoelii]
MDKDVCEKFENVWDKFPDKLTSDNEYDFKKENFLEGYCDDYECSTNYGKLNAGFFYLLNQFIGSSGSLYNVENNINVVEYIILWLSYMLNLKSTQDDTITNLNNFYIVNVNKHEKYNSFIDLINNKKKLMNISSDKVSKLYKLFKILCEMYTKIDYGNKTCNNYLKDANKFVDEYQKLLNDNDTDNGNNLYNQLLCSLSTDYDNLKSKCSDSSSFREIKTPTNCVKRSKQSSQLISAQNSEDISSSSIGNKLFTVLSIFGAIAFLLGISYKYSLFGFRKRFQKQKLREKLKNIKKRMNH